jgi:hypothetical protein
MEASRFEGPIDSRLGPCASAGKYSSWSWRTEVKLPGMEGKLDSIDWFREAREHAWNWFSLHANQRMQSLYYFLLAVAFLSAAYVGALTRADIVAVSIAVVGLLLTFAFRRLELRSRELIHLGEAALRKVEQEMANQAGIAEIQLVKEADSSRLRLVPTYRWAILVIQFSVGLGFVAAAVFAFLRLIDRI